MGAYSKVGLCTRKLGYARLETGDGHRAGLGRRWVFHRGGGFKGTVTMTSIQSVGSNGGSVDSGSVMVVTGQ